MTKQIWTPKYQEEEIETRRRKRERLPNAIKQQNPVRLEPSGIKADWFLMNIELPFDPRILKPSMGEPFVKIKGLREPEGRMARLLSEAS